MWYTNFSQSVDRLQWGPSLMCLTGSSHVYSFADDRILTGIDYLTLQGLPTADLVEVLAAAEPFCAEHELVHFAGQGMALPSVGQILLAYVLNSKAPWWGRPQG